MIVLKYNADHTMTHIVYCVMIIFDVNLSCLNNDKIIVNYIATIGSFEVKI